ncbi:MAG: PIN domain-containing protein [Chloroflexi bacterium]|nr:PIN domain-containing protein [Chloroflexota bacterium]
MNTSKLFLDANVFIAAAGSPEGGSSFVLELCKRGHFRAVCTKLVLLEAERNIHRKLGVEALLRFYQDLAELDPILETPPAPEEMAACKPLVGGKDAHVLAAALKSGAAFLLTLDRRHFMTKKVLDAHLDLDVMTPGDFLRKLLKEWG